MKIAVASTDGKEIDLHFGDAKTFFIFDLNFSSPELEELRGKKDIPVHEHTERWRSSIDLIFDCKAVLCSKIGKEPHVELRKLGIKVIELNCTVKDGVKECIKHMKLSN
ncbi:MAG: nitrogen fixation protein [Methanobrevibacter sp.]|jgi:predicted Fe-Mo cluster-binding NifX family protein|nr:nitrogen fixation protein [Candidatus Methanovirga basalitermitum]